MTICYIRDVAPVHCSFETFDTIMSNVQTFPSLFEQLGGHHVLRLRSRSHGRYKGREQYDNNYTPTLHRSTSSPAIFFFGDGTDWRAAIPVSSDDQPADYDVSAISDAISNANNIMVCESQHRDGVLHHPVEDALRLSLDLLQDIGMSVTDKWGQTRRYLPSKARLVAFVASSDIYLAESTERSRVTSSAIRRCVTCGFFDAESSINHHRSSLHADMSTNLLHCLGSRCAESGDVPATIMLSHSPCDHCAANILNFNSNFPEVKFHIRYSLCCTGEEKSIALLAENGVDISPISARERRMMIVAMDKLYNAKPSHTQIEERKELDEFNKEQYAELMNNGH